MVIGGGGHASVVIDAARVAGGPDLVGVVDADPAKRDTTILGLPVIGNDGDLPRLRREGIEGFIIGLGHSRSLGMRARLFEAAVTLGLVPINVLHPRAAIAASARLGQGVAVLAGAVVNAEAEVGDNVILNTGSIVEHHCQVGAHSHVAPGAILCGNVAIGPEVIVGAGARVREGLRVGTRARVGMGGVVVRDVPVGVTVAGNPARAMQERDASQS
jgi:UDP-perosamine 4-acetyltransferase